MVTSTRHEQFSTLSAPLTTVMSSTITFSSSPGMLVSQPQSVTDSSAPPTTQEPKDTGPKTSTLTSSSSPDMMVTTDSSTTSTTQEPEGTDSNSSNSAIAGAVGGVMAAVIIVLIIVILVIVLTLVYMKYGKKKGRYIPADDNSAPHASGDYWYHQEGDVVRITN